MPLVTRGLHIHYMDESVGTVFFKVWAFGLGPCVSECN